MFEEQGSAKLNFKSEAIALFKNSNYNWLTVCFTLQYATYSTLATVLGELIDPYGLGSDAAGIMGVTFIVSGVIGSMVFSAILDRLRCYTLMMKILSGGTVLSGIAAFFTLPTGNLAILLPNIIALGLFIIPIFSISYSFAVELTYPISEPMSNGIMVFFSQIFATSCSLGATVLIK